MQIDERERVGPRSESKSVRKEIGALASVAHSSELSISISILHPRKDALKQLQLEASARTLGLQVPFKRAPTSTAKRFGKLLTRTSWFAISGRFKGVEIQRKPFRRELVPQSVVTLLGGSFLFLMANYLYTEKFWLQMPQGIRRHDK